MAPPRGESTIASTWQGALRWKIESSLQRGLLRGVIVALSALLLLVGCDAQDKQRPLPTIRLGQVQSAPLVAETLTAAGSGPGALLAVGTARGEILLRRDAEALTRLPSSEVHQGPISGVAFTPDGKQLVSAGGNVVALWQVAGGKLVRQLRGPQQITALALDPTSQLAYFGTGEGHVLRWNLPASSAEPVAGFACAGSVVDQPRLRLPEDKRCPFGSYVEPQSGPAMCAYPVTALALSQGRLIRSCREGTVGLLWLDGGRRDYYLAGHLGALAALADGTLFLGRDDGELRLYDPQKKQVRAQLEPRGAPTAAAADGELLAVAQAGALRIFLPPHPQPLAAVALAERVIWLELERSGGLVRLLTAKGQLLTVSLHLGR